MSYKWEVLVLLIDILAGGSLTSFLVQVFFHFFATQLKVSKKFQPEVEIDDAIQSSCVIAMLCFWYRIDLFN